jgi:hypothetical protein
MAHERLGILLIILFAAISVTAIIARTLIGGNDQARLGVFGGTSKLSPCTGELKVSSNPLADGRCGLQAALTMYSCEGKKWYVFEGDSCSGTYMCKGNINEPQSIWKCSWEANKGTYTFTLCADSDAKAISSVTC